MLNPINHALTRTHVATYKIEPYVMVADIYGKASSALARITYEIQFENPNHVSKGVLRIVCDGVVLQTKAAMIDLKDDSKTHFVKAILGP